jgi:hypothetical protein
MEGIRSWFGRQIEKMTATYEEAMVREAKMLEDLVAHSDARFVLPALSIANLRIYRVDW